MKTFKTVKILLVTKLKTKIQKTTIITLKYAIYKF